jgi:aspartyl-tRNA(Asn)/glutamyl-tRNA(Gln) amidotransferase subunit A
LARTVEDVAMLLEVLAGFDPLCPESRRHPTGGYARPRSFRLDGLKLGVLGNFASEKHDTAISTTFGHALEKLRGLGAEIRHTALPTYEAIKGRRAGFVRVEVEAAYVHGDLYRREPERFSPPMRSYLDYGAKVLGQQLVAADRRIEIAAFELQQCLDDVDAIVSPTTPQAAPAFGGDMPENAGTYCILANFAGAPAISVPMGCDEKGLPLGLQIIGAPQDDVRVLDVAAAYQAAAGFRFLPPPPIGPAC